MTDTPVVSLTEPLSTRCTSLFERSCLAGEHLAVAAVDAVIKPQGMRDRFRKTAGTFLFEAICQEVHVEQTLVFGAALAKARAGMTRPADDVR